MAVNYTRWRESDAERRAALQPLLVRLDDVRRTRPRAEVEAEFLRRIGTPERLIGPTQRS